MGAIVGGGLWYNCGAAGHFESVRAPLPVRKSCKAVCDVLEVSRALVFASHSSCRALCNAPRNLSDDLIEALSARGGLVQINFHMGFISQQFRNAEKARPELRQQIEEEITKCCGENMACRLVESDRIVCALVAEGKLPRVEWIEIVLHIDHAVAVTGVDHVGLGSDFDGAEMPYGMKDASRLPLITDALLKRGYSEDDIRKILGGNVLSLMQDVEAIADSMREATE